MRAEIRVGLLSNFLVTKQTQPPIYYFPGKNDEFTERVLGTKPAKLEPKFSIPVAVGSEISVASDNSAASTSASTSGNHSQTKTDTKQDRKDDGDEEKDGKGSNDNDRNNADVDKDVVVEEIGKQAKDETNIPMDEDDNHDEHSNDDEPAASRNSK